MSGVCDGLRQNEICVRWCVGSKTGAVVVLVLIHSEVLGFIIYLSVTDTEQAFNLVPVCRLFGRQIVKVPSTLQQL